MALAKSTIFIDNDKVKITEWRLVPGGATGWHKHEMDYIVIPMMDGKLILMTNDGEKLSEIRKGVPYFRETGVEHDVINANDKDFTFIEVELKHKD